MGWSFEEKKRWRLRKLSISKFKKYYLNLNLDQIRWILANALK